MNKLLKKIAPFQNSWLVALLMTLWVVPALAQEQPSGEAVDDPSRETDIAEDNYRSFMELRDPQLERPAFPSTKFQPGAGLEKMAGLPESSQRHLRDQLRSVILSKGGWEPGDESEHYAFVPSPEAQRDGTLRRQEAEAWEELVGEYHQREAAIYAQRSAREGDENSQDSASRETPGNNGHDQSASETRSSQQARTSQQASASTTQTDPGSQQANNGAASQAQQHQQQQGAQPQQQQSPSTSSQAKNGSSAAQQAQSEGESQNRQTESQSSRLARSLAEQLMATSDETDEPAISDEGVAESALDFLNAQGFELDGNESIPDTDEMPILPEEETSRWGRAEFVVSTSPEPRSTQTLSESNEPEMPSDQAISPPDQNFEEGTLSIEQLRQSLGTDELDEPVPEDTDHPEG